MPNVNHDTYDHTGIPGVGASAAADVTYDHSASGLTATDVQAAIDEVQVEVDGLSGGAVPAGGSTGEVLKKASGADFDTEWA
ncbi:MAG: hypothetical protein M3P14_10990, partial [Chloroflexota bacterium]|nr:hypothetical protein [Chloroflexota bacterium]